MAGADCVERVSVFSEEYDRGLSERLFGEMVEWARLIGISRIAIEVADKYNDETSPHYHMFWVESGMTEYFAETHSQDAELVKDYAAIVSGEDCAGTVKIRVFSDGSHEFNILAARRAFSRYDFLVWFFYLERATRYCEESLRVGPIADAKVALPQEGGTIEW